MAVMAGCLAANDHAAGRLLAGCSWLLLLAGWLAGWPCMHVAAASTPLGKKTDALIAPDCPRPA
jgi:hypothetical protein